MLTRWRKQRARRRASAARAEAHRANPEAGRQLADQFPDQLWPPVHSVVAGYRPVRDEIDPTPLLETFYCEQARLALPCMTSSDQGLVFRTWSPGEPLIKAAFGVEEPEASNPEVRPALVLTPMLAFDSAGRRLGYGAGYYDRTLEALRAQGPVTVVGLAYEAQRLPSVPTDGHDQPLDWVVTEAGAFEVGRR